MTASDERAAPLKRGPRGRYAKSEQVRRTVLLACIEAFAETGYHGATMKDIAQRAGISQTGLAHHFPDKRQLMLAVLEERERQESALAADSHEPDFLHAQLAIARDSSRSAGLLQLHTTISAEAIEADHPAHEFYLDRYDNLRTFLSALFEMQRDHGRLKADADPQALANLFVAAIDGLQLQWLYHPEQVDIAESLEALIDALISDVY